MGTSCGSNDKTHEQPGEPTEPLGVQQYVSLVDELFQGGETVQTLLESLAEGLVIVDSSGTIVLVNRRTEEMFGYYREQLLGQLLNTLLPEQTIDVHAKHVEDYFAKPRARPMGGGFDLTARHRNGTLFPVEISLTFLQAQDRHLALAFVTDITLRKQAEMELRQRNEDLDAFAHTVAHDLQASLGVLVGYSEELTEALDEISPEELSKYLTHIGRNARKMNSIVAELLLLATMDRADIVSSILDTPRIVNEVLHRLHYTIEEGQAEIIVPDSYPEALGYAPWVEEVWYNYIGNALKYGGQPPRVELGGAAEGDGYVRFWVKDNGAGLTQEQQDRLFTPLTRFGQSQVKGHGLGLSIVKRIVAKLGGQVGVQSYVGQGSTFSFTLPGTS